MKYEHAEWSSNFSGIALKNIIPARKHFCVMRTENLSSDEAGWRLYNYTTPPSAAPGCWVDSALFPLHKFYVPYVNLAIVNAANDEGKYASTTTSSFWCIILQLHLKKGDVYFLIHVLLKTSHKPGKNERREEDRRAIWSRWAILCWVFFFLNLWNGGGHDGLGPDMYWIGLL